MTWQKRLKTNIRTIKELKKHIKLTEKEEKQLKKIAKIHPINITRYYFSLINKNDKNDPIRKIIIPEEDELKAIGSYDTSGEKSNTKQPGLQHKYGQTALILLTNKCAAYCRFCFRKRLVGLSNEEILKKFKNAVKYIKKYKNIDNVLVSGGDPLVLPTKSIEKVLELLNTAPNVSYIRFGTRIPMVFPYRIDKELVKTFKKYSKNKKIYIITHFNHPREITKESTKAVKMLKEAGVTFDNQTVLLKGVNDNPETLAELFNKLIKIDILPYYVFQCRPVRRVKHFQVPIVKGLSIFEAAKKQIKAHLLCKRLKYIMSHKTGKIEILGTLNNFIYFKYHQAKKTKNLGKFFRKRINKTAGWLDDF